MKKWAALFCTGIMLFAAGCDLDGILGSDDDDDNVPTSISELTIGGLVMNYASTGTANIYVTTVFDGDVYSDATVYLNGTALNFAGQIYTNEDAVTSSSLGDSARIAVYALGDSVVYIVGIPGAPSIVNPAEGAQPVVGDSLRITINYPGPHQAISMWLSNQSGVAGGGETTSAGTYDHTFPGTSITNAGAGYLIGAAVSIRGHDKKGLKTN